MEYFGDFIIPCYINTNYCNDDFEYRLRNIRMICELLPSDINIIVVEQTHTDQNIKYITELKSVPILRKDINYIEKQYDVEFVKGWLYNVGYRNSKTNNLFLGESDVIFSPDYWGKIYSQLSKVKFPWAHCWNKLHIMSADNKTEKRSYTVIPGGPEGGIVYVDKAFYKRIGGSNEWMVGLGGMDNEFIIRCAYHTKRRFMLDGDIYHLWHPSSYMKGDPTQKESIIYEDNRVRNRNIMRTARKDIKVYTTELIKYSDLIGGNTPLCEIFDMFNKDGTQLFSESKIEIDHTTKELDLKANCIQETPPSPEKSNSNKKSKKEIMKKKSVLNSKFGTMLR